VKLNKKYCVPDLRGLKKHGLLSKVQHTQCFDHAFTAQAHQNSR